MPVAKLKEFLDANKVKYVSISHSKAYTAMEVAESAHVQGKEMAKTVVLSLDGKPAMAVVPATQKVDLEMLRKELGVGSVALAQEQDFRGDFPGCEVGAMPPFVNLYGMDVFVEPRLAADKEIAFNAGSHTELIRMTYKDYERLVRPRLVPM
jgi:Ala-tRNA(Pro) deacylase